MKHAAFKARSPTRWSARFGLPIPSAGSSVRHVAPGKRDSMDGEGPVETTTTK